MNAARQPARSLPAIVAALLLLSTALLVLGVVLEHRGNTAAPQSPTTSEPAGHDEEAGHDEGRSDEHAGGASTPAESQSETVFGFRLESPIAVTTVAVGSVALAGLIWRRPTRWVAAVVAVLAAGAAVADVLEISHQAAENRGGLAGLAAVVACGHLAIAVGAVIVWRRAEARRPQLRPAAG